MGGRTGRPRGKVQRARPSVPSYAHTIYAMRCQDRARVALDKASTSLDKASTRLRQGLPAPCPDLEPCRQLYVPSCFCTCLGQPGPMLSLEQVAVIVTVAVTVAVNIRYKTLCLPDNNTSS